MMKRDQDNFDMHNFEDLNGYAVREVFENALIDFHQDFIKKGATSELLWPHMEGMIWFWMVGADQMHWHGMDDGGDHFQTVAILGRALLSTISVLVRKGKFKNEGSPIKNIALILAFWIKFAVEDCGDCEDDENGWAKVVVKIADAQGLEITGPHGIEEQVKEVREEAEDMDSDSDEWAGKFDWKKEFSSYCKGGTSPFNDPKAKYGIGGRAFDLLKRSKKDRRNDPATIGPGPALDSDIGSDEEDADLIIGMP